MMRQSLFSRPETGLFILAISLLSTICTASELSYKEYEEQLAALQVREKNAKEAIALEQGTISSAKQKCADAEEKLRAIDKERNDFLGITANDISAAQAEVHSIRTGLEQLLPLSPGLLTIKKDSIAGFDNRIVSVKSQPASLLQNVANEIAESESLCAQLKSKLPAPRDTVPQPAVAMTPEKPATYIVKLNQTGHKRETLKTIAGYDFVYGDTAKWVDLYRANKTMIDKHFDRFREKKGNDFRYSHAEDLIFPGQELIIPR